MSASPAQPDPLVLQSIRRCEAELRGVLRTNPLAAPHAREAFEVLGELGAGGMGQVLRIRDRRLGREAALKLLKDPRPELRERFLREARVMARLDHPNIPPAYEAGLASDGQLYLLMKLIRGQTLREVLAAGALDLRGRLGILIKVCEAAAYAHSQGVVHRDIKPENIMIGEFGEVLLMDWGIARVLEESASADAQLAVPGSGTGGTEAGALIGTPGYAAPEQLEGEAIDGRADVFALGCLLTELATGQRAITGETTLDRLAQAASGAARSPRQVDRSCASGLDAIARAALRPEPGARTSSAEELARQLEAWLADEPLPGLREGLGAGLRRGLRRRAERVVLAGGAIAAVAIAGAAWFGAELRARQAEVEAARAQATLAAFDAAEEAAREGAPEDALRAAVNEALERSGRDAGSWTRSADILARAGLTKDAREMLRLAADRDPPAYEALALLHELEARATGELMTAALRELDARAEARGEEVPLALFARGARAQVEGRPDEALALYERAIAGSRSIPMAYNNRGLLRWKHRGEEEAALADLSRALELDPRFALPYLNRARLLQARGEGDRALAAFDAYLALEPKAAFALRERGVLRRDRGDLHGAELDFEAALALEPQDSHSLSNRGQIRRERGDLDGARRDFELAIEVDPENAFAHANRCGVLADLGRKEEALESAERALAIDPELAIAHNNRAVILRGRGEVEAAREAYGEAIRLAPQNPTFVHNRAKMRFDLREYGGALEDYTRLTELRPRDPAGYYGCGLVHAYRGEGPEALERFDEVLRLDPKHLNALTNRGLLRQRQGDLLGARRDFDRACALVPAAGLAFFNRGCLRQETGDLAGAEADYSIAMALGAERAGAPENNRGRVREQRGDLLGAARDYERAVQLNPESALLLTNLASAQARLGDWESARRNHLLALEKGPEDLHALTTAARSFAQHGERERACALYERAIPLAPDAATKVALRDAITRLSR